jgi:Sodium/hydrogen exchanger family
MACFCSHLPTEPLRLLNHRLVVGACRLVLWIELMAAPKSCARGRSPLLRQRAIMHPYFDARLRENIDRDRPTRIRSLATFEWLIGLLLGAVLLSALARRIKVPYPTFLAIGGMLLAFVPSSPSWTLEPDLALALFVAPVLMDAAFDTSLRDLRKNWLPVSTLVFVAVGLTTAAVAVLVHWLLPDMPWAAAIALGAIVAPPDAAAATAILRQVKLPHRILKILEGESLLNDASALLIYRVAVGAAAVQHFKWSEFAPSIALALAGKPGGRLSVRPAFAVVDPADRGRAKRDHRVVCRHLHGLDRCRAYRPLRYSDDRRLRDHDCAHRAGANARAAARALLRGVGNSGVCSQRAGLHADRHAVAPDLGAA